MDGEGILKVFCALAFLLSLLLVPGRTEACTGIRLKAQDGSCIYARTMEFGTDLLSCDLAFVPRGQSFRGNVPSSGLHWTARHASVGFSPFGMDLLLDGINEKGLACGGFFLPGYAQYQTEDPSGRVPSLSCLDLVSWVLGTCATVEEVRRRLPELRVVGAPLAAWNAVPPLHYFVADPTGDVLVVEYLEGNLVLHDGSVGVITNSPDYRWHLTNLRNYIGLRPLNDASVNLQGVTLSQFGQGSGAVGLPGDFTPPSRFVRAVFLTQAVFPPANAGEGIGTAFHILNQFDIPRGALRDQHEGRVIADATQWTCAADLTNRRYTFHTMDNRAIRMVDLNRLDPEGTAILRLSVQGPGTMEDLSGRMR